MSSKQPYFTVIMCNYNYDDYIGEAISSILGQSYTDFELIVVDDGSTDHSTVIIDSFIDKGIQKVFKPNGGQASAFNAGMEVANGKYIALIDSDDWWTENKLQRIYELIEYCNDDKIVLYQHMLNDVFADGVEKTYKNILPSGNVLNEMKRTQNIDFFIPTSGMVFRKDIGKLVFPIPKDFWFSADAYLMRTLIVHGNVQSTNEVLGYHRVHDKSFTNTILKDDSRLMSLLVPHLNSYYKKWNVDYSINWEKKVPSKKSTWDIKRGQLRLLLSSLKRLTLNWKI